MSVSLMVERYGPAAGDAIASLFARGELPDPPEPDAPPPPVERERDNTAQVAYVKSLLGGPV